MKLILLILASFIATIGITFLRRVNFPPLSNLTSANITEFFMQPNLWLGAFCSGTVFLLYIWALSKYETSFVVPTLLGINLIMISIFSILFFGETLTLTKIAGYALIFSGVWFLI